MKLLYFAWVRERMGRAEEEVAVPPQVLTVRDLIGWLADRDDGGRLAFTDPRVIRAAADQSTCRSTIRLPASASWRCSRR